MKCGIDSYIRKRQNPCSGRSWVAAPRDPEWGAEHEALPAAPLGGQLYSQVQPLGHTWRGLLTGLYSRIPGLRAEALRLLLPRKDGDGPEGGELCDSDERGSPWASGKVAR